MNLFRIRVGVVFFGFEFLFTCVLNFARGFPPFREKLYVCLHKIKNLDFRISS